MFEGTRDHIPIKYYEPFPTSKPSSHINRSYTVNKKNNKSNTQSSKSNDTSIVSERIQSTSFFIHKSKNRLLSLVFSVWNHFGNMVSINFTESTAINQVLNSSNRVAQDDLLRSKKEGLKISSGLDPQPRQRCQERNVLTCFWLNCEAVWGVIEQPAAVICQVLQIVFIEIKHQLSF